jgi:ATP-binding cassette subfamily B protein
MGEDMKEILKKNKTYNLWDFIRIPVLVSPECTLTIGFNRILSSLVPSFKVLITAQFVDTALAIFNNKVPYQHIYMPLFLYVILIIYSSLNRALINNFINVRYDMKIYRYFRSEMIEKRAKLEYKHIENNKTWDLITRTCNDPLGKIAGGMNNLMDIADIVIRVGTLILILMTQVWWAALVIFGITVPLLVVAAKGGKNIYEANKDSQKHMRRADYLHRVLSNRENIEERTMFGYTDNINKKWYEKFEIARKIKLKVDMMYFIRMKASSIMTVLISIVIIGFLLLPLSKNDITIGMFMGLTTATLDLVQMMSWQLAYVVRQLAENREYLKDLTEFMSLSEQEGAIDYPVSNEKISFESIEFKDVSFKYPDTDKYILKNLTLTIKKNIHYAFVGINGAGKTTLTKLLTGMYDNYTGDILINGKNIREYKLSELKAIFTVVYQDFAKYFISMKDNILLGNILDMNQPKEDKITNAIHFMEMEDVVDKLPNGLNSDLGKIKENGVDLSGGEWQRLAIVRALYNDSFVRILDEPTAALDPVAESNIYEMFGKISENRTTIFITHRLGAAKLADEIIVLDDGKVAEKGNHETLLDLGGIYSTMFESQRSWYQS